MSDVIEPKAIAVRPATDADGDAIARLLGELGYPVSSQALAVRLAALRASGMDEVLVATLGTRVVGCIGLHAMHQLHAEGRLGRITAMVVASGWRGQGIGQVLLGAAHVWFDAMACVRREVTSGDPRAAAHRFYQRHGYARHGLQFTHTLSRSAP